jgi:uncharacterized protein (TIGR02145 family)
MKLMNPSIIKIIFYLSFLVLAYSCKFSDPIIPEAIIPVPTLLSPAKSAIDISISPILTWNATTDAVSYTLQVSTDSLFSSFVYNQNGLTTTSQQLTGLSHLTTYYWRVSATNNNATSGWSTPTWSFTTTGSAPGEPSLSLPANNTTNIGTSPLLAWNASSGATSYTLQVSNNSSFSSFVYNQNGLTTTNQIVTGLGYSTAYFWRVSASNSYGTSGWSTPIWSFTTTGPPPNAPTLSSPANNAIDISISPVLVWNTSADATSYTLQVSTNSSFSSLVHNQTGLTNTTLQLTGLSYLTTYYWRVSATNNNSTSGWSTPAWSFTTTGTAPYAPPLFSPANNAIDVETPPLLVWSPSTGATSYALQVSVNSSFSSFVYNQSGLTSTSQQITGLNIATTYYWRVSATNSYGTSGWSSSWTFTTRCMGTVSYLGKSYNVVQVGRQCWLRENMDVGLRINKNVNQTNNGVIEKYCFEDNEKANCTKFGGLYQWDEAMQYSSTPRAQGICPTGWHIPTLFDLETLSSTVNNDGNALKAEGEGTADGAGTNTSGFSALLAGYGYDTGISGVGFVSLTLGQTTFFWSSTKAGTDNAYYLKLLYNTKIITRDFLYYNKNNAFSVRCIKD